MAERNWDVIVVGGGIAGLVTTILLAHLKLKVLCIEAHRPASEPQNQSADLRSTAYLLKSIKLLKKARVWDNIKEHAEELKIMQICDAGGTSGELRQVNNFNSQEIDQPHFGYNIPNWFVKKSITTKIEESDFGEILFGQKVVGLVTQTEKSTIRLSNSRQLSAKLIIAADGKDSDIRYLSKINVKKWDNNQDALAFITSHEKPHNGKSIEILESGGPCTFVPMKLSKNGSFQSAVVWMENRAKAKKIFKLTADDFSKLLTDRSKNVLGTCQVSSRITLYPIVSQLAERFYCRRLAIIAEAAHVMPPIGAQGLNTSFEDISLLIDSLEQCILQNDDIGSQKLLKDYGIHRRLVTQSKMLGVSVLNKTSKSNLKITKDLRKLGLKIIEKNSILKRTLMKAGLGYI